MKIQIRRSGGFGVEKYQGTRSRERQAQESVCEPGVGEYGLEVSDRKTALGPVEKRVVIGCLMERHGPWCATSLPPCGAVSVGRVQAAGESMGVGPSTG